MSFDSDVRAVLLADLTVASLASARIYPLTLPQNPTLPAITYQRISAPKGLTLDGPELTTERLQVDSWATTHAAVRQLSDAVRAALHGYSGASAQLVELLNESDYYEQEVKVHRVRADYRIQGVEA
jgi:hypothetical protein